MARDDLLGQLVAAHDAVYDGLLDATADLDEAGWATPTGCPGWDVHDQLAHCVGLERLMLGEPTPAVEVPDLPHLRDDVQRYLERDVQARRGLSGEALRAEARETFDRRRQALAALTPEDLEGELDSPMGRMRAPRALRFRVFDLVSHEQDVRRALGREADFEGPGAEVAVEQVLRAWVASVPGRLDDPPALTFDIAGRGPVTVDLRQGELYREAREDADARVAVRPADVVAIGCGRADAPTVDDLEVVGDRERVRSFFAVASITP